MFRSAPGRGTGVPGLADAGAAALALAAFDWTASGLSRPPALLVLAMFAGAALLGIAAAAISALLRRPALATGLVAAVALVLEGSSTASKELAPGSAHWIAASVVLACSIVCLALAWIRRRGPSQLGWSALAAASVPAGSIVACLAAGTSSAWPRIAAIAAPVLVFALERVLHARRAAPYALLAVAALPLFHPSVQSSAGSPSSIGAARQLDASPATRDASGRPSVVLLVIDTLRSDALDTGGGLAAFAREGAAFRNAFAVAPWTLPSIASLLTAHYPSEHGAVSALTPLPDSLVTLAEVLRDAGYATGAFTGGAFVGPSHGLAQGFDAFEWTAERRFARFRTYEPLVWRLAKNRYLPLRWLVRAVDEYRGLAGTLEAAREWLASEPRRPVFLLLHTYQVHDYYLYDADTDDRVLAAHAPPSARFAGRLSVPPAELRGASQSDLDHFRSLYDGRVAAVDSSFTDLVRTLEPLVGADALWVVTSDHGEGFDASTGRVHHGGRLHDDLLHVPLAMRAAGRIAPGTVVDASVRLVDVLPTVLDALGLPALPGIAGESLLPALRGERAFPAVAFAEEREHGLDLLAVRRGEWKAIDAPGHTTLYAVQEDPGERHPVVRELPPDLATELERFRTDHPARPLEHASLDAETIEHLQDLGYVE